MKIKNITFKVDSKLETVESVIYILLFPKHLIQVHTKKYHLYALEAVSTGLWHTSTDIDLSHIMTEPNHTEPLTHLVHEPEEREQCDDERRVDPDLHQRYLRLGPPERDFGRFVYDRPRVDLFALHECCEREHAEDVPALLVHFLMIMNDRDRDLVVLASREFSVAHRRVVGSLPRVARAIPDEMVCLIGHCLCWIVFLRIFVLELESFLLQPLVPLHLKHLKYVHYKVVCRDTNV